MTRGRGRALRAMLPIGVLALTGLLVSLWVRTGNLPIARRSEILIFSAWAMALLIWFLQRRGQTRLLTAVGAATLAMLLFFAVLLAPWAGESSPEIAVGKFTHILLALFGFTAFAFAAGVAVLYLWEIRVLKSNPQAAVARSLPPLEVLDKLNFLAVVFGFPLLALSVLGGWVFLSRSMDPNWWLDPMVLATLSGLLVYVVLFGTRTFLGWYGRRMAWLTVVGFAVIVIGVVVGAFCTSATVIHPR